MPVYFESDKHLDTVYTYLKTVLHRIATQPRGIDEVPLILDVLLPEVGLAIISACSRSCTLKVYRNSMHNMVLTDLCVIACFSEVIYIYIF